jgi:hypothetical protein
MNKDDLKKFMEKQNIIRLTCDGKVDDKATVLSLIDWARYNVVHAEGKEANIVRPTEEILQVAEVSGKVMVGGCEGVARLFEEMLASVDIKASPKLDSEGHYRLDFPSLELRALHADDLFNHRFSNFRPENDTPSRALLAPMSLPEADMYVHYEYVASKYPSDWDIYFRSIPTEYVVFKDKKPLRRATIQYGEYFTPEQIKKHLGGEEVIKGQFLFHRSTLRKLDEEIDKLGGPKSAKRMTGKQIIWGETKNELVALREIKKNCK